MHISEGVLSPTVLVSGFALTAIGLSIGLKKMTQQKLTEVAVVASAFFMFSFIHVPIGPTSAHLLLNGIIGILLGWMSFLAIFVALLFQALVFQYGGLTVLGVNTFMIAAPSVFVYYWFIIVRSINKKNKALTIVASFSSGLLAVALAVMLFTVALIKSGDEFRTVAKVLFISHIPIMVVEGTITAMCVTFLLKVKPEILNKR